MIVVRLTRKVKGLAQAGAMIIAQRRKPKGGDFVVAVSGRLARVWRWRPGQQFDGKVTHIIP